MSSSDSFQRSISIVLCTFNGGRFLDQQMRSLRQQTGVQEIVVVDDRSTDDTMAILQQHAAEDPRVRVHWNERQLGIVANFERAIGFARGEWIALSDQDDVWVADKIARLRAAWDGRSILLHHATRRFRGEPPARLPARAGEARKFSGRDVRRLLYRNTIVGHTVLVRSDVARALMPFPRGVLHDWWLGAGATLHGAVQYLDEYLVHYRIHETNAYHPIGSRRRRLRAEHDQRRALLAALAGCPELTGDRREFVESYRQRLIAAEAVRLSPALAAFYWRQAAVFFGKGNTPVPSLRRARKSLTAALGATGPRRATAAAARAQPEASGRKGVWANVAMGAALSVGLALSAVAWTSRGGPAVRSGATVANPANPTNSAIRPAMASAGTPPAIPAAPVFAVEKHRGGVSPYLLRQDETRTRFRPPMPPGLALRQPPPMPPWGQSPGLAARSGGLPRLRGPGRFWEEGRRAGTLPVMWRGAWRPAPWSSFHWRQLRGGAPVFQ